MASDALRALDLTKLRTELARSGQPWQSTDTSMTMLDEDERHQRLGVPLPTDDEVTSIQEQGIAARAMLVADAAIGAPAAFDARNVGGANYVTPVKNQGSCGSCVAFGTLSTVETTAAFTRGQPGMQLDLSEAHLFYVHGPATGASCGNGWWPELAFAACRDIGVTFEDYMPYTPGNSGGAVLNGDWPNRLARLTGFDTLTGNVLAIKNHLVSHGSVSACLLVYQDFFSYRSGVYRHVTGALAGGHCVSLVGYDDAQGCWIAKNSWGSGWGDNGFFRIAYGDCGIDTWRNHGAAGVNLRMWCNDTRVQGLWHHDSPNTAWSYLRGVGWTRLAPATEATAETMLTEFTSARLGNRPVNAFHDNGTITQAYVL